ncbi:MAG: hypothetical protein WD361_01230, partial [Gracilimonas sp.]
LSVVAGNCDLNPYGQEQEEVFVSCFEFTIGNDAPEISLELPDSAEVWPTIPRGGASHLFDFTQIDNMLEDITVAVLNNEEPVSGQPVNVTTEWIEGTGGHNHNGNDDLSLPPQNRMGWIINTIEADSAQGQLETVTNEDGKIRLIYRAPEFGGQIRIIAQTNINGEDLFADDTLEVMVPDLVRLPNSNEYNKIGGTSSHNGPPLNGEDNNHYGTQAFVDSLGSLAVTWNELADSAIINADETPLRFNDMSLPNGGKFDLDGRWLTELVGIAHDYHRVGRDLDIRTTRTLPVEGGRIGILLEPFLVNGEIVYRNTIFEELCTEKGANPIPRVHGENTSQEHYHIYFYH